MGLNKKHQYKHTLRLPLQQVIAYSRLKGSAHVFLPR